MSDSCRQDNGWSLQTELRGRWETGSGAAAIPFDGFRGLSRLRVVAWYVDFLHILVPGGEG
jgi:hypothetical protein